MERPRSSRNCLDMFDPNALSVKNKFRHIDMNLDNTDFTIPERSIDEALNCTQTKKVDGMGEWGLHKQIGSKHDPNRYKPQPAPPSPKRQYDIQFTQIHDSDDAMPTSSLSSLNIPNTSTVNNSPIAGILTPKSRQLKSKLPLTPSARLRQKQISIVNQRQLQESQNKFMRPLPIAENSRHHETKLNGFSPMIASTPFASIRVRKSLVPEHLRTKHPETNHFVVSSTDEVVSVIDFSNSAQTSTNRQEPVSTTASKLTTPPPSQKQLECQVLATTTSSLISTATTNNAGVRSSEQIQVPIKIMLQQSFTHQSSKKAIIEEWHRQKNVEVASSPHISTPETPKAPLLQSRIPKPLQLEVQPVLLSDPSINLPLVEKGTPKTFGITSISTISRTITESDRCDKAIVATAPLPPVPSTSNTIVPNLTVTFTVNNAQPVITTQESKKSDNNTGETPIPGEQNIAAAHNAQTRQHQALYDSLLPENSNDIGCTQKHLVNQTHCETPTSHLRSSADDHNLSARRALFHEKTNQHDNREKSPSKSNERPQMKNGYISTAVCVNDKNTHTINRSDSSVSSQRSQQSRTKNFYILDSGKNRSVEHTSTDLMSQTYDKHTRSIRNETYDISVRSRPSEPVSPQVSLITNQIEIHKETTSTSNRNAQTSKPAETNRQMDKSVESVVHQEIILSPTDHSSDNNSTGNIENSAVETRVAEQELQPEICENLELSAKSNSSALSSNSSNKENSVPGLGLVAAIATQKSQLTKENQPNYNCKVVLTRLRNDWENLNLYHRRQANLRESETFSHLEPPTIFRDESIIEDIDEKSLSAARKTFRERLTTIRNSQLQQPTVEPTNKRKTRKKKKPSPELIQVEQVLERTIRQIEKKASIMKDKCLRPLYARGYSGNDTDIDNENKNEQRESAFHKGKNTEFKIPQTVRNQRSTSIKNVLIAAEECEQQNSLDIANGQSSEHFQNESASIIQPRLTRSKSRTTLKDITALPMMSTETLERSKGIQERCVKTAQKHNETQMRKKSTVKRNTKREVNVDTIEVNNNNNNKNHKEQAQSDIDEMGTRKLRAQRNKSEWSWSTNRVRLMGEALAKKSQKSHSQPQSKSRFNGSQQIKRKTKSSRSKPNTSIVHEPDDEFDDGAENNVRPARKKPRSMDTKTQSKKSKSTSDAGDGQLNVSGQLSIDPLVFQEQCWLIALFNRDTLNKSKQSEEVDLNFLTLPEGTIEFTKFASIGFIEVNGVEYGYFPSKNKTNGIMRFQPNAVKPMTTQSDPLIILHILAGSFVLTCGKEKNAIRSGCLIKIPGGIEYEIKCTDPRIGVIMFYVIKV